ncbi:bifunctional metallophosphatase/5'-nucleotidase [Bifidobacterium reuteri]|uniref:Bifunctional metallophosphatase/5'-nucleotidase n=1 Tax=Bifidobacterium reuteri TaxID=983706 RepID=A0A5J5EA37_9BIFI|nr:MULTISPECIES: 5'-nucleotidase C-terminal domain-containing protein [Bifidobacterium]KAA8826346.1 bifunctional metallophosphatase/5'-nucleotidase [Bifidobacterium reuteri]TPF79180.1 5'-nucleotidase [Bifidobacterium sp. UTCIF-1]TPF81051.1 5'-nucleotidase [Bifidobacterium sp. UTCIF-24]TPF83152.1 5'-nucleotidase [Bifidobacterium sp. UTCIF-3]TPF85087.1 5'-nucleotidase [Bifidobacterium sp. UTCIF-36]
MNRRQRWIGGKRWLGVSLIAVIASIATAFVVPNAMAGASGAVPFSGDDPAAGTRTVTVADITDFHGHIERGADVATAFTLANGHNAGNMVAVSAGDLVGGSPYESAVAKDRPTLDMAREWGLTISAVGNHEFDRSVADFNNRIADPANGIDWLCANVSAANKAADGKLSRVKDYTIRTVNGKRIGFVGALTDALGSVATPQITRDADLSERAVDAINRVAGDLKRSGKVDAVVALLHADASAAKEIGRDVDLVYAGHSHAVKQMITDGGAPVYEAGSYGQDMAVQDLIITGHGSRATVRVADVDLGNGTGQTNVQGVLAIDGLNGHSVRQAAWMSAGADANGMVARAERTYAAAQAHADTVGEETVGSLAKGKNFDKRTSPGREGSVGMLVADANRASIMRHVYAGNRLPVVGFSNDGSLRTDRLDLNRDGSVTVREVDSLLALQFKAAHETLTGRMLKAVLAQQFGSKDGRIERRPLGISSNVAYHYVVCGEENGAQPAVCEQDTDSSKDSGAGSEADGTQHDDAVSKAEEAFEKAPVRIVDLTIDGTSISDDDLVIIASNSYLLQGGDSFSAFRAGSNYGELDMPYSQPLIEYLAAHPLVRPEVPVTGTQA